MLHFEDFNYNDVIQEALFGAGNVGAGQLCLGRLALEMYTLSVVKDWVQ